MLHQMDVFVEYLVKRRGSASDIIKKVGLVAAAAVLFAFLLFITPFAGPFSFFSIMAACGVVFGAYYLITAMNVEYEYIMTNHEIDVDKIIAQRKRKRLVTVDVSSFERFCPFHPQEHNLADYDNCIMACIAPDAPQTYCAMFQHHKLGRTLLVFNPDERILKGIKQTLPRRKQQHEHPDGN